MITQTIKQWLSYLFAWWPWKRRAPTAYAPPSRNGATGIPPEHSWSASGEGALPQTGARSVVVEQSHENVPPEVILPLRSPSVEDVDFSPLRDIAAPLPQDEKPLENLALFNARFDSADETSLAQISEQRLAFLQYLVSHGLVNEGFEEGEVPEQYRRQK
jgi:hypothetical protein